MSETRAGLHRAMQKGIENLESALRAEYPEYERYNLTTAVRAYRNRPDGFSSHQLRIVTQMLQNNVFLAMPNADMVAHLELIYPGYIPSASLMYARIYPNSKRQIERLMAARGFNMIISSRDTLSSIKRFIRGQSSKSDHREYNATIEFTADTLVVNGLSHSIDRARKYPSVRIDINGRGYLRCDQLEQILKG